MIINYLASAVDDVSDSISEDLYQLSTGEIPFGTVKSSTVRS